MLIWQMLMYDQARMLEIIQVVKERESGRKNNIWMRHGQRTVVLNSSIIIKYLFLNGLANKNRY